MKITVIGSGYVGLIAAVCFAGAGNEVVVLDVDQSKVDKLNEGVPTIHESGLEEKLAHVLAIKKISFTTDKAEAITHGEVIFIAVGTPESKEGGSTDLSYVKAVATDIGTYLPHSTWKLIVTKSTVPPGTAKKIESWITAAALTRSDQPEKLSFTVASNPEFLREGQALSDFYQPERVVVGVDEERETLSKVKNTMHALYDSFLGVDTTRLLFMSTVDAELTKYAANAMLATRISFMNEMSQIATRLGANVKEVQRALGLDSRIGNKFLNAGLGYGGSCFPKDVASLTDLAHKVNYTPLILHAVHAVNEKQASAFIGSVTGMFGNDLRGLKFAVLGVAFKPGTDDVRKSPALAVIEALSARGATTRVYDSVLGKILKGPDADKVYLSKVFPQESIEGATAGADAILICTEDTMHFDSYMVLLDANAKCVFDGRNIFSLSMGSKFKKYVSIGRPTVGTEVNK